MLMSEGSFRLVMVIWIESVSGRDPWLSRRKLRFPGGRSLDGQHDQHIGDTEVVFLLEMKPVIVGGIRTMRAVKNGESPQKTDVFVGAFIPRASVPIEGCERLHPNNIYIDRHTCCNDHSQEAHTEKTNKMSLR
jgi:hypothetical protein